MAEGEHGGGVCVCVRVSAGEEESQQTGLATESKEGPWCSLVPDVGWGEYGREGRSRTYHPPGTVAGCGRLSIKSTDVLYRIRTLYSYTINGRTNQSKKRG